MLVLALAQDRNCQLLRNKKSSRSGEAQGSGTGSGEWPSLESSGRPALQSSMKTVKRIKLDTMKAAAFVIGTVLKLSTSSIDLARYQGLIRDFDFLAILVFFNDLVDF